MEKYDGFNLSTYQLINLSTYQLINYSLLLLHQIHIHFPVFQDVHINEGKPVIVILVRFLRPADCCVQLTIDLADDSHVVTSPSRNFGVGVIRFLLPQLAGFIPIAGLRFPSGQPELIGAPHKIIS